MRAEVRKTVNGSQRGLGAGDVCWHTRSVAETVALVGSDAERGIAPAEAARRLAQVGSNTLTETEREPWWHEVVESLTEPLVLLLIAVGVVYALLGEIEDAIT